MAAPSYTIMEPHPTVPQNAYTHAGRGGAGNTFRAPQTTSPAGVPSKVPLRPVATHTSTVSAAPSGRFYSGRGGAGNAHAATERQTLNFDEEYAVAAALERASSRGHVGRGGAGNAVAPPSASSFFGFKKERKQSDASNSSSSSESTDRRDSSSTTGSVRSGFWGRLSHH